MNKLKILSIGICLISASWAEAQCMEEQYSFAYDCARQQNQQNMIHNIPLPIDYVQSNYPSVYDLYIQLPSVLPKEIIKDINKDNHDIFCSRVYKYNDWVFEVPPYVFEPSSTSKFIFDAIQSREIDLSNKKYLVMGVGAGIEPVIAASMGVKEIIAIDIHPESVMATEKSYYSIHERATTELINLHTLVSDLFNNLDTSTKVDVITFNPPAVSTHLSEDKDITRNTSIGASILQRFFEQIKEKDVLSHHGKIYIILSNTSELHKIISYALINGFYPHIVRKITRPEIHKDLISFLFCFQKIQK